MKGTEHFVNVFIAGLIGTMQKESIRVGEENNIKRRSGVAG
ncbi:MAG: hypothetical protein Q7U88_05755 [Desulfocapsaceae bacterium]|nr:hypothetical protein [Desulfocapsaceae bacterium]